MHGRNDEHHPFDYDWQARFPEHEFVLGGEGWAVFSAQGEGAWWLVFDDGTLADFMDSELDADRLATLVRLQRFDDRDEWEAAVEQLRRRGRPNTRRMVKRLREDG